MNARGALILSAVLGLVGALLVLGLPLLAGYWICAFGNSIGLCDPQSYLLGAAASLLTFAGVVTLFAFGSWYVFRKIPSTWVKLAIGAAVLLIGIFLFQPEIDLIGLAALAFAYSGDKGALKK